MKVTLEIPDDFSQLPQAEVYRLVAEAVEKEKNPAEAPQQDVEKQRRTEEALKTREERYRQLYHKTPVMLLSVDREGVFVDINDYALETLGYQRDEMIGHNNTEFLTEKSRTYSEKVVLPLLLKQGYCQEASYQLVKKNGEILEIEFSASVERGEEGKFVRTLGIGIDVTERKKAEIELRQAKEQAESASWAKSQFLANMSHEIRTPLNSIVGFSQIMLKKVGTNALSPDFKQYLENIRLSGQNLSELINNILDLSKIEAGKTTLLKERLNLKQLFRGIFHINKAQAIEKNLQFSYEWDPRLPDFVQSDRTKFNQILMNLTSNAIKFTPQGKRVTLTALRDDNFVLFEVQDEGIGISQEQQGKIFEDFQQADSSTTRHFGGTGLGLAITRKMVTLLNGTIRVESVLGQGSVFSVRIPLEDIVEKKKAEKMDLEDNHFASDNQILLVEDNLTNQQVIQLFFEELGLYLHLAGSGRQGIQKAQDFKKEGRLPDLILMDLHMPQMDGFETTQAIRKDPQYQDVPIVALSADVFTEQQKEALELGIKDYLTKPIDFEQLLWVVAKYLRKEQSREPKQSLSVLVLPDDIKEEVLSEFTKLSKIPIYLLDDIIEQVQKIRELCEKFDSGYPALLQQIDQAAYSGDEVQFHTLVKQGLNP